MPGKAMYQYLPTNGVRADFKRLMNDFIAAKTVRFEKFSEIWRKRKFSFLCAGRCSEREAREFQVRVGGLYLLYGIFMTQPIAPKVKVRLTVNQWVETIQFQQEASQQHHLDVVFIFNKMLEEHAFQFCYTSSEMNERSLNSEREDNEVNLADEMKEERREINRLFNYESMEQLSYLLDHYHQMKVSLAGPSASKPDKSLDVVQGSMVEDLVQMLQSFKESVTNIYKHGRAQGVTTEGQETPGAEETILNKRKAIKAAIYSGTERSSPVKKTASKFPESPSEKERASIAASSPSKPKPRASNSSCEEEDNLEVFVSSSSSRGRRKIGHKSTKKFSRNSSQKEKSCTITKRDVDKGSLQSKAAGKGFDQTCSTLTELNHDGSESPIELEYFDSVDVYSKRGGKLASKLEEIAKDSGNLETESSPANSFKGKRGKSSPKKSPKKSEMNDLESECSDNGTVEREENIERENVLSKQRKSADRKRMTLDQNQSENSKKVMRVKIISKKIDTSQSKTLKTSSSDQLRNTGKIFVLRKTTPDNQPVVSKQSPDKISHDATDKSKNRGDGKGSKFPDLTCEKKTNYQENESIVLNSLSDEESLQQDNVNVSKELNDKDSPAIRQKRISRRKKGEQDKEESPQHKAVKGKRQRSRTSRSEHSTEEISSKEENESPRKRPKSVTENDSSCENRNLKGPSRKIQKEDMNESVSGGDSSTSLKKKVAERKKNKQVEKDNLQAETAGKVVGRRRSKKRQNEPQEISSEEENSSPRKKSKTVKVNSNFKEIFNENFSGSSFPRYSGKVESPGFKKQKVANKSRFNTSKAPLSKVIGGKSDVESSTDQVKKHVKIIKIVTKGKAEAQEVLKSIQKQKVVGNKLLGNLPSHLVRAIKVDTKASINRDELQGMSTTLTKNHGPNVFVPLDTAAAEEVNQNDGQQSSAVLPDRKREKESKNVPKRNIQYVAI